MAGFAGAAPPVSYQRDVQPILRTACLGCHAAPTPSGGFALESYVELMKGGKNGPAIVPGKSANSRLVQMMTGAVKPQMPPVGALKPNDIEVIRRWVDEGAKADVAIAATAKPGVKATAKPVAATPAVPRPKPLGAVRTVPAPIYSLAFSPDGKTVAVGTYQRVLFCDPNSRQINATWSGLSDAVRALTYSPDGKSVAAGSGISGAFGEVRLWSNDTRKAIRTFGNQTDSVTGLAFSPDGKLLLSASMDKSIQIWDALSGKPQQTLRDHADAVLGLAFRNDGKYLATCSTDKSVKVWDTASWKRLYTVGAHDEPVTAVAFSGDSPFLTISTDRTAKVWNFAVDNSGLARTLGGHGGAVLALAISPDGKIAATTSADKTVKLWNIGDGANIATLTDMTDWAYAVRFSPDGKRLAAGSWNGLVYFWNVESRKCEGTLSTLPVKK